MVKSLMGVRATPAARRSWTLTAIGVAGAMTIGCTDRVARGRELYLQHGCAVCHGQSGRGDGPASKTLTPPPRDLANPQHLRQGASEEAIADSIANGIDAPGSQMPPFSHISEGDRKLIAAWIVSLQHQDGGNAAPAAGTIAIRDAWVRATPPSVVTSAAYATIENTSDGEMTLIAVTVAQAQRAELHTMGAAATTRDTDTPLSMGGMRAVKGLPIPARGIVSLAPGGTHVMLFDVAPALAAGASVTMTFSFANGQTQTANAIVRPPSATGPR
jgi:periplasmic copper chaperone A